jgi:lipopolysaccharide/colanic/teichoic acid biosynthesis glycosyltransferase
MVRAKEKHVMKRSVESMTKRDTAGLSIAGAAYQQDTVLVPGTSPARTSYVRMKRILDVVIAVVLLLLLLPLLGVVALVIRLTSPGPVLFRQQRVGQGGRLFIMYKFRSMVVDADPRVHEEAAKSYRLGQTLAEHSPALAYKLVGDPRVTRLGALLRKTSVDELPQLFNVIRGDMSLIGPRPALPYEVACYTAHELLRLSVPQGMTGLWQVKGRSHVSYAEALALDVEYARLCSFALDCKILLLTIPTLVFARGGA